MPVFGFNTDVKVGKTVFHVQTEDRGAGNPVLNTTIYVKGRVLAKRGASYQDFLASPDFNEAELHAMLERQHKQLVEEVKAGRLTEVAQFLAGQVAPDVLAVLLLNPNSFFKGPMVTLELQTRQQRSGTPVGGAKVRALLHTGTPHPVEVHGVTGADGKLHLEFPKPSLGSTGAELQIQATATQGTADLKYTIRPKPKNPS